MSTEKHDSPPAPTMPPEDEESLVAALRQRMIGRLADELMPSLVGLPGRPEENLARLQTALAALDADQVRGVIAEELDRLRARQAREAAQDAALAAVDAIRKRQRERHEAARKAGDIEAQRGFDWWLRAERKKILDPAWRAHMEQRRAADPYFTTPLHIFANSPEARNLVIKAELQDL